MYWLIYRHKNQFEGPQAKSFDFGDEIQEWVDEQKNIDVIDIAESLECEEDRNE